MQGCERPLARDLLQIVVYAALIANISYAAFRFAGGRENQARSCEMRSRNRDRFPVLKPGPQMEMRFDNWLARLRPLVSNSATASRQSHFERLLVYFACLDFVQCTSVQSLLCSLRPRVSVLLISDPLACQYVLLAVTIRTRSVLSVKNINSVIFHSCNLGSAGRHRFEGRVCVCR